jgi:hypothetical protein
VRSALNPIHVRIPPQPQYSSTEHSATAATVIIVPSIIVPPLVPLIVHLPVRHLLAVLHLLLVLHWVLWAVALWPATSPAVALASVVGLRRSSVRVLVVEMLSEDGVKGVRGNALWVHDSECEVNGRARRGGWGRDCWSGWVVGYMSCKTATVEGRVARVCREMIRTC